MDSWHSWSSDSRWLLFASKRGGQTTRVYLSRISEAGSASAPIEIVTGLGYQERVNMPTWYYGKRCPPVITRTAYEKLVQDETSKP
jgi:Tol biopolymer transport system component